MSDKIQHQGMDSINIRIVRKACYLLFNIRTTREAWCPLFLSGGVCMTAEEHRKFLGQDFDNVKIEELKDISKIRIDRGKTVEEKKKQYLGKVGNPYLVKVGSTMVRIRFANNGVSFEDAFEGLLLMG